MLSPICEGKTDWPSPSTSANKTKNLHPWLKFHFQLNSRSMEVRKQNTTVNLLAIFMHFVIIEGQPQRSEDYYLLNEVMKRLNYTEHRIIQNQEALNELVQLRLTLFIVGFIALCVLWYICHKNILKCSAHYKTGEEPARVYNKYTYRQYRLEERLIPYLSESRLL